MEQYGSWTKFWVKFTVRMSWRKRANTVSDNNLCQWNVHHLPNIIVFKSLHGVVATSNSWTKGWNSCDSNIVNKCNITVFLNLCYHFKCLEIVCTCRMPINLWRFNILVSACTIFHLFLSVAPFRMNECVRALTLACVCAKNTIERPSLLITCWRFSHAAGIAVLHT